MADPPDARMVPAEGRLDDEEVEARLAQLDDLLGRVEGLPGPGGELARDAVALLADVYGEALGRTLSGTAMEERLALARDPLVGHLMALHGLHPEPPERRVEAVISEVRHRLGSESVRVEGVEGGVARLKVSAGGCGDGLPGTVRDLVLAAAPELTDVETSGSNGNGNGPPGGDATFIPVEALHRSGGHRR